MNDAQYIENECADHTTRVKRCLLAPLSERQAARAEFLEHCNDTKCVSQMIGSFTEFLLGGDYGFYPQHLYKQLGPRQNKNAFIFTMIALYEFNCPVRFANQVYNKLSSDTQDTINNVITHVIKQHEENEAT